MIEIYSGTVASPSGASAGIFIPRSDLPGIEVGEFASGTAEAKRDKAILALLNKIFDTLSPTAFNKLGWSVTKSNPTAQSPDLVGFPFSATIQFMADHSSGSISPLPVPTTGANNGVGDFAIADIFPNAAKIAADGEISGEGIVIPTADLQSYGSPSHASLNPVAGQDNRSWLAALYGYFASLGVRSTSSASALITNTRGGTTAVTLPAAATAETDPTTGILASNLGKLSFFSHQYSITVQALLNQTTQKFEVNSVTS